VKWRPSAKLRSYLALALVGVLTAFLTGRPEPAVLAAPFALAIAFGLATTEPLDVHVVVDAGKTALTEGERAGLTARFRSAAPLAGLEVFFVPGPAFAAVPDGTDDKTGAGRRHRWPSSGRGQTRQGYARGAALRADQPWCTIFMLEAQRWGIAGPGALYVRARSTFGLLEAESRLVLTCNLTVYPSPQTLLRLVRSRSTRLAAGAQVAQVKASGVELAEVRPYVHGDRARDVNWRASARHGGIFTNEKNPDRGTDVVLFLDAFDDVALTRAVRAACSLAEAYLAQRDRLALVSFGGFVRWVRPGTGLRQRYVVVDALLSAAVVPSVVWKGIDLLPRQVLPPNALVVGVSSLNDERAVRAFADMRGRGIDVVVVEVSPLGQPSQALGDKGEVAYQLWQLQRAVTRTRLRTMGVPVAEWTEERLLAQVIEEIDAWPRRANRALAGRGGQR
jgi:uncharacterized protein (DUF58 family)